MKITSEKAAQFTQHCRNLATLAGFNYPENFYEGLKIYEKLNRLERKCNRLQTWNCNTGEDTTKQDEQILKAVQKLLPNVQGIFINGDPRGYSIKIKESEVKSLPVSLYTDWGGYGILAPEF
jgi:hypothetical protein